MRILHVATAFPRHETDVITPWLGRLLVGLKRAGHDVSVLAPAYRGGGATRWRGIPVRRFRYAPGALETLTHDETVPDRLRHRPAYAALLPGYLLGGIWAAARLGPEHPDVVHVHWPFPHALFGAVARASSGGRTALVSSFYSVEIRWVERRLPVFRPFLRWSIETADAVTAISSHTARALAAYTDRPVSVIPFAAALGESGIEEAAPAATLRAWDPAARPLRILFVGRLVERKGVEVLVEALRRIEKVRPASLTVVGEGPRAERIRRGAVRLGLEGRVRLEGRVADERLERAYREADVFVLPAVVDERGDTEGLGVVLLEALRFGVPVVASRAGGIPDIVRDGDTGWLVPPGDPAALARTILEVACDPAEAERRVARGRAHLDAGFSLEGVVRRLERCYEEAVVRRRGAASSRGRYADEAGTGPGEGREGDPGP